MHALLLHVLVYSAVRQADEVGAAHPRIVEAVETMLKKGKWSVPGTCNRVACPKLLFMPHFRQATRRSSATFRSCNLSLQCFLANRYCSRTIAAH